MMAVVILAIAVSSVAMVLSAARAQGGAADDLAITQELARQLMEEITAKPFADPDGPSFIGPEAGESTRDKFDNVDDYHNYTDTTKRNNDRKQFVRTVSVQYRALRNGTPSATGDFAMVKVSVVGPDGRQVALNQLVTCTTPRR